MTLDDQFQRQLAELARTHRLRTTRPFAGADRVHPVDDAGRPLLSFCTNDYLGLAGHPVVVEASAAYAAHAGLGAAASRLVAGESPAHRALEADLARFLHLPAALLFPTGYQTNIGVITALAAAGDLIASDAANHASIIDGCRLSRARVVIYPHADADAARRALATDGPFRRRLLVTESVFSMDGDRAPLADLARAASEQHGILIVDEAHAIGVAGPQGRGLAAAVGVIPDVTVGTLGKSLGSLGGFAAGSDLLREVLVNTARSFVFTTASPPALCASASAALAICRGPDGEARRRHAATLAQAVRAGLERLGFTSPGVDLIVPVVLGDDAAALSLSARLQTHGILVPAIRPPTVPEGTSRLRITLSAAHTHHDITRLLAALAATLDRAHPQD
ncbi:MAG: 8-amino-7-oxononanoate synthase [Pseudomonadota bacterium]